MNLQFTFSVAAVVASAVTLVLGVCNQATGIEDRFIAAPPDESELAGMWRPDKSSLVRLAAEGFERTQLDDHFVTLNGDHSCFFNSYWDYGWDDDPLITTNACTWQISTKSISVHHIPRKVPAIEFVLREGLIYLSSRRSTAVFPEEFSCRSAKKPVNQRFLRQDGGWTHVTFFIAREDGKIVLWDFIGDPDYSIYMDFLRVGEGGTS